MEIKVKYHADITPLEQVDLGDYVDLRCAETVDMKKGEFKLISLGVSMALPKGYYAEVVPRSSTYKKYKIIMANSMGIIDYTYRGNDDVWMFPALATEDTHIDFNDRICQFKIDERQPAIKFTTVDDLGNENRGGIGSTGVK